MGFAPRHDIDSGTDRFSQMFQRSEALDRAQEANMHQISEQAIEDALRDGLAEEIAMNDPDYIDLRSLPVVSIGQGEYVRRITEQDAAKPIDWPKVLVWTAGVVTALAGWAAVFYVVMAAID